MRTYGLLAVVCLLTLGLLGLAACGHEKTPTSPTGSNSPTGSAVDGGTGAAPASGPDEAGPTPTAPSPGDAAPAEAGGGSDGEFTPPSDWCGTGRVMGHVPRPRTLVGFRSRRGLLIWVSEKDLTPAKLKELSAAGFVREGLTLGGWTGGVPGK